MVIYVLKVVSRPEGLTIDNLEVLNTIAHNKSPKQNIAHRGSLVSRRRRSLTLLGPIARVWCLNGLRSSCGGIRVNSTQC